MPYLSRTRFVALYQPLFSSRMEQLLATFLGGVDAHPATAIIIAAMINLLFIASKESKDMIEVKLYRELVKIMAVIFYPREA